MHGTEPASKGVLLRRERREALRRAMCVGALSSAKEKRAGGAGPVITHEGDAPVDRVTIGSEVP